METPADGEIPDLPEEIIVQILQILPVKSLLRFKCVCKSWHSLISSSGFIKTHLKYSINNANLINNRIMFAIINPKNNLKHCSAHSLMFEPLTVASEIDYPGKNPHKSVWVVGSCNGLICFAINEKDIYLWNPSTRTSKKLPCTAVKLKRGCYDMYGFYYNESDDDYKVVGIFCDYDMYGFGYNESDDDYKVVGIFCDFGKASVLVKIYSLRTNSWKRIGNFEDAVPLDDSGKFASGKIHFIAKPEFDSKYEWAIVSLDLKSEVYGKVELPNFEKGYSEMFLGVLGGCICVILNYRQIRADVWVSKEYDVKESWTKVVSIPYFDTLEIGFEPSFHRFYSNPLLMLPNSEILLVFEQCLVIYNPRDNSFRRPGTSNIDYFLEADIYVESLVSLQVED